MPPVQEDNSIEIREVWFYNLESEMALIRDVVYDFPFVAMDTEFPGTVYNAFGDFDTISKYNYETIATNVNYLEIIQLGLTFFDENGRLPTCGTDKRCIWQFNFHFDLELDKSKRESIDLLIQSGVDFEKHERMGIISTRFGELLMTSGAVLNENVRWVTFHGAYDFGYVLRLLIRTDLPETLSGFLELMKLYFPGFYDIKHLMKFFGVRGGLKKLAELLDVERVGVSHQAGSDSLLSSKTFMALKDDLFCGNNEKYSGVLFGLAEA